MNPIEFLKHQGYDTHLFRSNTPQQTAIASCQAKYYDTLPPAKPSKKTRKKRVIRAVDAPNVQAHSLLTTFLHAHGWTSNGKTIMGVFIPYLLADLVYLTHDEYLKGRLKQKAKKHCNAMMDSYDKFIHDFFKPLNEALTDEAVDMMDEFGRFIHNDLEIFRLATIQPLSGYPLEFRKTLSAICVCRLLCAHADRTWTLLFSDPMGKHEVNPHLASMEHNSAEMFRWFTKDYQSADILNIDLPDFPIVRESMCRVSDRILEFIKEYDNSNRD